MKIFIGNLGEDITSAELLGLFASYGCVRTGDVVKDINGKSRGFGYVIMNNAMEGEAAIYQLNKKQFKGQFLVVSEAIYSKRYESQLAQNSISNIQ